MVGPARPVARAALCKVVTNGLKASRIKRLATINLYPVAKAEALVMVDVYI